MPVVSLPLLGLALGVGLSWSAGEKLRNAGGFPTEETFRCVLLFSALVPTPLAACLLIFHPDWCLSYTVAPGALPQGTLALAAAANLIAVPLGFVLGRGPSSRGDAPQVLLRASVPLLVVALLAGSFWMPLSVEATYSQYENDFGTHGLAGSVLGYTLLWMALVLVASVVYT